MILKQIEYLLDIVRSCDFSQIAWKMFINFR